jgi:hypothetical protein
MKKFSIGIIAGIAMSAAIFVPLLRSERHDKFEFGRKNGINAGLFQAADAIQKELGCYDGHSPYKVLFSVKTTDVVSTETNGVKTIRVIP